MLNPKAFANAATVVSAVFFILCWILSALAPDLIFQIAKSWMHSINLETLKAATTISLETAILGLISFSLFTWFTTYITIWLYNKWAKK